MAAAKSASTPRPGINWLPEKGKLYRFTRHNITVIKPWPHPRAWVTTDVGTGGAQNWRGDFPGIRLDVLPMGTRAPYPHRFELDAWETVPDDVRALVASCSLSGRQWMTLCLLARCPGAAALLTDLPLLGAAAANVVSMRAFMGAPTPKKPWRDLRAATRPDRGRQVRKRVARLLRWPASQSLFRVLGRVRELEAERWDVRDVARIPAIWAIPSLRKVLQHGLVLSPGRLAALSVAADHVPLAESLSARLFLDLESEHDAQNLAGALRGLRQALRRVPGALLPARGTIQDIEAIETATHDIIPKVSAQGPLPHPPLPGTPRIVPLLSDEALRNEGRQMNHCIGYGGFARRARARQGFGYRILGEPHAETSPNPSPNPDLPELQSEVTTTPSLATLWIEPSPHHVGRFCVGQLQGPGNSSVSPELWEMVERWLSSHAEAYRLYAGRSRSGEGPHPQENAALGRIHADWAPENGAPENGAPENGAPENGAPSDIEPAQAWLRSLARRAQAANRGNGEMVSLWDFFHPYEAIGGDDIPF